MIPKDGMEIGYECPSGHINDRHKKKPTEQAGDRAACIECGAGIVRKLVPAYRCEDCGNVWFYGGDYDRPTCPACKGKRTAPVE